MRFETQYQKPGTAFRVSRMPLSTEALVERHHPSLSEHDYRIKGLTGLIYSFSESNRAHLYNL